MILITGATGTNGREATSPTIVAHCK